MDANIRQAIESIHKSQTLAVLYVTGGASHAVSWLLSVPGASSTILEARVPYDRAAFVDIITAEATSKIRSFASASSARALARAAYQRAVVLAPPGARVCGIAAACSLATSRPKRGDHIAFVTAHSHDSVVEYHIKFNKGLRNRWEEDLLSSKLVVQALLDDASCPAPAVKQTHSNTAMTNSLVFSRHSGMQLVRESLSQGDSITGPHVHEHADPVRCVVDGHAQFVEFINGRCNVDTKKSSLIFPGSFNPLHHGHRQLMAVAKAKYPDAVAAYEISVTNPDKPALKSDVIYERLQQFNSDENVIIASAPFFTRKAELYPNSKFVVGTDTALRIVAPKYYGGEEGMVAALIEMKAKGCKILVAGRLEQSKTKKSDVFQTLGDVRIPVGLHDLFEEIPGFRVDISSSDIRETR